jgi:hypothetical protein
MLRSIFALHVGSTGAHVCDQHATYTLPSHPIPSHPILSPPPLSNRYSFHPSCLSVVPLLDVYRCTTRAPPLRVCRASRKVLARRALTPGLHPSPFTSRRRP